MPKVTPWKEARIHEASVTFRDNHLFTFAAAIAFRVIFATVPFAMFVLAVLGFLHLQEVWSSEVAPDVRRGVSPPVYQVIDDAVRRALSQGRLFWATIGGAIALWIMSSAVRAAMDALDEIYAARRRRPVAERIRRSLWLAASVGGCLLAAAASVRLGPLAIGEDAGVVLRVVSFAVRWGLAAGFLGLAVFLIVRYAPATPQPVGWVSLGSGLSVTTWIVMSVAFGAYTSGIASYGSTYGSLASLIVLFTYVYLSAIAFLFGVQLDALVREEAEGDPSGRRRRRRR
jgi:membrane protein